MSGALQIADIAERRDALAKRVTILREERGRALVKGEAFDNAALTTVEGELAALSDAESEIYRQRQAATAEAEQIRRAGIVKLIHASEERRQAALRKAEAATRELASAIPAIDTTTAETCRLLLLIGERDKATQISVQIHPSMRMGALLTSCMPAGSFMRWGDLQWPDPGYLINRMHEDWAEASALDLETIK